MSKSKGVKLFNRKVRKLNKELSQDVFGDRFYLHQVCKERSQDGSIWYFMYEMIDRVEPNRNVVIGWFNEFEVWHLFGKMNDFIVESDFWSIYWNKPDVYKQENDSYWK